MADMYRSSSRDRGALKATGSSGPSPKVTEPKKGKVTIFSENGIRELASAWPLGRPAFECSKREKKQLSWLLETPLKKIWIA